jgi:hypothetical protein
LEIWVVCVEELKLDLVIETLEKHILLLLIGVDVVDGVPQQLNELVHIFIHRHTSLVQISKFLLLQLEGAAGHIVSPEMSLELISANSTSVDIGVAISLPPVCYGSKQLVHYKKDLHTVRTLSYLQLLLD